MLSFEPSYHPNIFFGTTVMSGNSDYKGMTVKGRDGMFYADITGMPWHAECIAYSTNDEAIHAILKTYA